MLAIRLPSGDVSVTNRCGRIFHHLVDGWRTVCVCRDSSRAPTAAAGFYNNTTSAITSRLGRNATLGSPAEDQLRIAKAPSSGKPFAGDSGPAGLTATPLPVDESCGSGSMPGGTVTCTFFNWRFCLYLPKIIPQGNLVDVDERNRRVENWRLRLAHLTE
jgi:hypothetical protein